MPCLFCSLPGTPFLSSDDLSLPPGLSSDITSHGQPPRVLAGSEGCNAWAHSRFVSSPKIPKWSIYICPFNWLKGPQGSFHIMAHFRLLFFSGTLMDSVHLFQIIFTTSLSTEKETGLDRSLKCKPARKTGPYLPHPKHHRSRRVPGTTFWAV